MSTVNCAEPGIDVGTWSNWGRSYFSSDLVSSRPYWTQQQRDDERSEHYRIRDGEESAGDAKHSDARDQQKFQMNHEQQGERCEREMRTAQMLISALQVLGRRIFAIASIDIHHGPPK